MQQAFPTLKEYGFEIVGSYSYDKMFENWSYMILDKLKIIKWFVDKIIK